MSEHTTREVSGVSVIDVAESYSRATFLELLDVVKGLVAKGSAHVLLNMTRLSHINSEGIGLLVLVHDLCEKAGGKLALCCLPQRVGYVLRLAGVVNFFNVYDDEREGLAAFAKAAPAAGHVVAAARAGGAPAEAREEHPDVPTDPAEVARAARQIVRTTIRSRRHHEAIEFFAKRSVKVASLDEIASSLGIPRLGAEQIMRDLARSNMVIEDGEMFVWQPSSDASLKLSIFRRALSEPRLRSRLMAWLYAEEKK